MVFEKFQCTVAGHEKGECVMVCTNLACKIKFLCTKCLKTFITEHTSHISDLIEFEKFIQQLTTSFFNGGCSRPDEKINKEIKDIKRIQALKISGLIREGKRAGEQNVLIKNLEKWVKARNSAPKSVFSFSKLAQKAKESNTLDGNLPEGDIKIKKKAPKAESDDKGLEEQQRRRDSRRRRKD